MSEISLARTLNQCFDLMESLNRFQFDTDFVKPLVPSSFPRFSRLPNGFLPCGTPLTPSWFSTAE